MAPTTKSPEAQAQDHNPAIQPEPPENFHEAYNREVKATAIVNVLYPVLKRLGDVAPVQQLAGLLDDEVWELARRKAEVLPPSDPEQRDKGVSVLTRARVMALLEQRERLADQDPFEGLHR